ncbi:MAG: T9SS type A sorting domain-containing protein [Cyclobacteriaceae bacterium]|nr:T9SS type A sorting domain-containing protein [Cyclobacteriaceae bacterium]
MRLTIIHIILLLFVSAYGYGQSTPLPKCATMEADSINRAKFPQRGTLNEFEEVLQRKIRDIAQRRESGTIMAGLMTIPIIVHIIHNGEPVGSGMNLSQAQVQSQIQVLNEDFRKMIGTPGYNTHPAGADIEIEFCLSPVDENGVAMTEPGIHRYDGNKAFWTMAEVEQLKPLTIWNPNLFYNVWTVKFGGTSSSLLGYAQFPDQSGLGGLNTIGGPASTDGVVIQYTSFGSGFPIQSPPYNKGRTLSHETGHWLGLRHIWGDGVCGNDFVSDTPTVQNESRGCPTSKLACDGSTPAMVQNYMDYSDDACMNIFTNGQKTRMQAVMALSPRRKTLIEANLCSPIVADVPTANFTSDKQLVLLGGQVAFTDLSTNFPNGWSWIFEGGDPNTSTQRNPKVKYHVPGEYKVTLTATNTLGSSIPLEAVDYITVSEEGLCSELTNFLPAYTPSVLPLSDFGAYTGYLTGHNSTGTMAISEFFVNTQGYEYISGVEINFGHLESTNEEATVNVVVWNARGLQNGPGSVVEKKVVLLKQIKEDIDNNRPTVITFDRETPVFSRPFQVGIELSYTGGEKLAIVSSDNGEATGSTSWTKSSTGVWSPYTIAFGANIAMDIRPIVGVNPSVQIASSAIIISPQQQVVLNARGASVFVWSSDDGSVVDVAGPQLIVRPTVTTVYTAAGSGLELCHTTASTTVYVSDLVTGLNESPVESKVEISPNPGSAYVDLIMENSYVGPVSIQLNSLLGTNAVRPVTILKTEQKFKTRLDTQGLPSGLYILQIGLGESTVIRKWVKN